MFFENRKKSKFWQFLHYKAKIWPFLRKKLKNVLLKTQKIKILTIFKLYSQNLTVFKLKTEKCSSENTKKSKFIKILTNFVAARDSKSEVIKNGWHFLLQRMHNGIGYGNKRSASLDTLVKHRHADFRPIKRQLQLVTAHPNE